MIEPGRSILIVQTGFLGDAVLASGMLRAIAAHDSGRRAALLVRREFAELFAGHPAVSRLHLLDKRQRGSTSRMIEDLRPWDYDEALLPHRSFRSSWIACRAGIGRRIGFRQSEAAWLLTDRVEYDISLHETERNARLLSPIGIAPENGDVTPWLVPDPVLARRVADEVVRDRPTVVVAPGSVWATKRWLAERYAIVVRRLVDRGWNVLLAGSESERRLCRAIADQADLPDQAVVAGKLAIAELLALVSMAARVIGNDSAPIHLAESVGTPSTAIFGPTVPEFGFAPALPGAVALGVNDLACRPCTIHGGDRCPIGTHECMTRIEPEHVLETVSLLPGGPGIGSLPTIG